MDRIFSTIKSSRWKTITGVVLLLSIPLTIVVVPSLIGSVFCDGVCVETVSGESTITVTYAVGDDDPDSFTVPIEDDRMANTSAGWAWIPRSSLPPPLKEVTPDPSAGVVTVGEWALVGQLSAASEQIGPREVTIVAPTESPADPAFIASELSAVTSPYDLEPTQSDPVLLIYAPRVLPDKGRMYDRTGYVTTPCFRDGDVSSVWIHEYLHSVQNFETEPEMRWVREASATYFPMRFLAEQYQDVGEADVRHRLLALKDSMVCLCNTTACSETNANYYRGARLLYAIDSDIRRSTNGNRTLVDVFRELNARDDSITIADFQAICEDVSGTEMDWIRSVIQDKNYDLKHHITEIETFGADANSTRRQIAYHPVAVGQMAGDFDAGGAAERVVVGR